MIEDIDSTFNVKSELAVKNLATGARRVYPRNNLIKLLNNHCQEAIYLKKNQFVLVVVDDTVKTVYKYDKSKWLTHK
jgi:hypothetical protein